VWKRRGDETDEAHDAWLGEVDEAKEADEKVAKRRRLVAAQMTVIGTQARPYIYIYIHMYIYIYI